MTTDYRKALRASLLRTHWVLSHPSVGGAFVMAAVHGAHYTGPVWYKQPEIQAALKLAGLPPELPEPKYAESEVGVFRRKYRDVAHHGEGGTTITVPEHVWEEPSHEDALFLGTWSECHDWVREQNVQDDVIFGGPDPEDKLTYYVTRTGREIDRGEEAAFFAQFEEA